MTDVPENKVYQVDDMRVEDSDLFALPRDYTLDAAQENRFVDSVETGGSRSCGSILFSVVMSAFLAGWLFLSEPSLDAAWVILVMCLMVGGAVWLALRSGTSVEYGDAVLTLDEPPVTGGRLRAELYTGIPVTVRPDGFVAVISCNRQTIETTQVTKGISKSTTTVENLWCGVQQVEGTDTVPAGVSRPEETVWGFTIELDLPDDVPPTSRRPDDPENESEDAIVWVLSVSAEVGSPRWQVSWEVPVRGALDEAGDRGSIIQPVEKEFDLAEDRSLQDRSSQDGISQDPFLPATAEGHDEGDDDAEEPAPVTSFEERNEARDDRGTGKNAKEDAASDRRNGGESSAGERPDPADDPWMQPPVRRDSPDG